MLTSLAAQIREQHELALSHAGQALEHARSAGELLLQAKAQIGHGQWLPWLASHCRVGARQAQKYMRLAEHWDRLPNTTHGSHLAVSAALKAIAAPREAAPDAIEEYEQWEAQTRGELAILAAALESPSLTIEAVSAIYHRAEALWLDGGARQMRAFWRYGELLNRVEAEYGKEFADLVVSHPEAVIAAADARLAELERH